MENVIEVFTRILIGLRAVLGAQAGHAQSVNDITKRDFFGYLSNRIGRAARRLEALFARWKSGTLPPPWKPRPGRTRKPAQADHPKLPRRHGWLGQMVPPVRTHGAQLQNLLNDPEWPAFLEAAPQARRILRPLLAMLGIEEAAPLGRIIPHRAFKPARPEPTPPPAPWAHIDPDAPPSPYPRPYLFRTI